MTATDVMIRLVVFFDDEWQNPDYRGCFIDEKGVRLETAGQTFRITVEEMKE